MANLQPPLSRWPVSVAYDMRFEFKHSPKPIWGAGITTEIRITLKPGEEMQWHREQMMVKIMHFGALCGLGAFGIVPPVGFDPMNSVLQSAKESDNQFQWRLKDWPATDDSLTVLASLLMGGDVASVIEKVEVSGNDQAANVTLAQGETPKPSLYPAAIHPLPFPCRIEESSDDQFKLELQFRNELTKDMRADIEEAILFWAVVTAHGAYGVAPVEPLKCGIQFSETFEGDGFELHWQMWDFRAHPEALNGLINVIHTLHHQTAPVLACRIR